MLLPSGLGSVDTKTDTKLVKTDLVSLIRFVLIPQENEHFCLVTAAKKGGFRSSPLLLD
jgi:hypothetical protein